MAKEEMYHIALDDYEHGIIIRSLNDEKTDLMNEGKSTDAVDDLIIKVGTAPKKKFKVIEKERSYSFRHRYYPGRMAGTFDCALCKRRIAGNSAKPFVGF